MCRHDGVQCLFGNQLAEDCHVMLTQRLFVPRIAWGLFMRIRTHRTVTRKMFAGGLHARLVHPGNKAAGDIKGDGRIGMERTVANRGADMTNIEYRRKADINIHGDHLGRHLPSRLLRQFTGGIQVVQRSKRLHGRQLGEAVTETLHATALLIHRHYQPGVRGGADLPHQLCQLSGIMIISRK